MHRAITTAAGALAISGLLATPAHAEPPASGRLLRDIEHLQVVGSVLYVAAHPDDENTRLLSWLVGQRGLRATYLSMTRGGGGQNLIGTEQAELLGVVRTGELLAARSVDGASQRFTRTRDFGYSKSAEETLSLWGRDHALADVLLAMEQVRPDVVITRFPTEGRTHGHHLASAILARDAFDALQGRDGWRPDRLLHNVSSWHIDPDTDTSGWLAVDVGGFDPRVGRSWGEVAAMSRTMHKSQGFGSAPQVGPQVEYFAPLAGAPLQPGDDPFAGLDLTWGRFQGTGKLAKTLAQAARRFDPAAPHAVLPTLARAHALLAELPDPSAAWWREVKTAELEQVMADCAGLWLTARADRAAVAPGKALPVTITALSRAPASVTVHEVRLTGGSPVAGGPLSEHAPWTAEGELVVPATLTVPHWLAEPPGAFRYTIADEAWRTAADTPPVLRAEFDVSVAGRRFTITRPVERAWTDPVAGERRQPVEVLPPVTATFAQPSVVLPVDAEATTRLVLRAPAGPAEGTLRLTAPEGVVVRPSEVDFTLTEAAPERILELRLSVDEDAAPGPLRATVDTPAGTFALQQTIIDHPHLPRRTVLRPAAITVAPVAIARGDAARVGYVMGSGDQVPEALRAVGYTVEELDEDAILERDLARYDAIVLGVRAFNTRPRLHALREQLLGYVEAGGRLIVQYNTNNRLDPLDRSIGPAPLHISRDRVTDETAAMTPVNPDHPALTTPNALTAADFDGWVQERGLYFADDWDPLYQPIFSVHDPGEAPLLGSTLVARHGDGVFVYTGLSFFRQLPAGVPGAYRLFANLLALEVP